MEISNKEIVEVSLAVATAEVHELDELQLALVGGGYGETIL
jgi:hypothetical protein